MAILFVTNDGLKTEYRKEMVHKTDDGFPFVIHDDVPNLNINHCLKCRLEVTDFFIIRLLILR